MSAEGWVEPARVLPIAGGELSGPASQGTAPANERPQKLARDRGEGASFPPRTARQLARVTCSLLHWPRLQESCGATCLQTW